MDANVHLDEYIDAEYERIKALDQLLIWANAESIVRQTHRSLVPEEVYALGQGELVEIGAHTVTHPFLSAQSKMWQQNLKCGNRLKFNKVKPN